MLFFCLVFGSVWRYFFFFLTIIAHTHCVLRDHWTFTHTHIERFIPIRISYSTSNRSDTINILVEYLCHTFITSNTLYTRNIVALLQPLHFHCLSLAREHVSHREQTCHLAVRMKTNLVQSLFCPATTYHFLLTTQLVLLRTYTRLYIHRFKLFDIICDFSLVLYGLNISLAFFYYQIYIMRYNNGRQAGCLWM